MVENVIFKSGSFTDWAGEEHPFIVAGVTVVHDEELVLASVINKQAPCALPVIEINGDGHLRKSLFIGVSICNPKDKDTYNEEIGKKIAFNKALSSKVAQRWIGTDIPGMLTKELAELVVSQEVKFIAAHPEAFIKGYFESKARYERKKQAEADFANMSAAEQTVVKTLIDGVDVGKLIDTADALNWELPVDTKDESQKASGIR